MPPRSRLVFRLLKLTLFPPGPTGPRSLGRVGALILFVPAFLLLQGLHWVGFLLDDLLFRGYRKVEVEEPLFIVGLPRSGTTFLQRLLALDTERFTTLRLWELLLAPSVTERKLWLGLGALDRALGRPLGRLAGRGGRRGFKFLDAIHEVSWTDPEEDYLLLLPVFACFLLVISFPYHEALWRLARFDDLPEEERGPILEFYRSAIQRHLFVVGRGKRLLSKNPSFTSFVGSLSEAFPGSRILCCVRDPMEVVPSQLSSLRPGGEVFGWKVEDPLIRDRFMDMLEYYAHHALQTLERMDEKRQAFVPLPDLKTDPGGLVLGVYARFGWKPDPGFLHRLAEESDRGKRYRSHHRYTLEEFGLGEEEVRRRFRPLNERFGFHPVGSGGPAHPRSEGNA